MAQDTNSDSLLSQKDSLSTTIPPLTEEEKVEIAYGTFGVSFTLLLLVSLCKYFLIGNSTRRVWAEWFCELSIDTLTIFITILTAYYYRVASTGQLFSMFFGALVVIAIVSMIRRALLDKKIFHPLLRIISYILCWVLCLVTMFLIYKLIFVDL